MCPNHRNYGIWVHAECGCFYKLGVLVVAVSSQEEPYSFSLILGNSQIVCNYYEATWSPWLEDTACSSALVSADLAHQVLRPSCCCFFVLRRIVTRIPDLYIDTIDVHLYTYAHIIYIYVYTDTSAHTHTRTCMCIYIYTLTPQKTT